MVCQKTISLFYNTLQQNFININPWTQFFDLKDRKDIPLSYADHVTMK